MQSHSEFCWKKRTFLLHDGRWTDMGKHLKCYLSLISVWILYFKTLVSELRTLIRGRYHYVCLWLVIVTNEKNGLYLNVYDFFFKNAIVFNKTFMYKHEHTRFTNKFSSYSVSIYLLLKQKHRGLNYLSQLYLALLFKAFHSILNEKIKFSKMKSVLWWIHVFYHYITF